MNLRPLVQFLRKSWLLIGVLALAGAGVAGGYVATQTPQYESTTRMFVSFGSSGIRGNDFHAITDSYAELAKAPVVLDPVINGLRLKETAAHLAERVKAETGSSAVLIKITVTDPDPVVAADVANAIAKQIGPTAATLSSDQMTTITQIEPAIPPRSPTYPSLPAALVLGLLDGMVVGIVVAAVRNQFGGRGGGGVRLAPSPQMT